MEQMMGFQLEMVRKFEVLEKRIAETSVKLEDRSDKLEKVIARYAK